MNNWSSAILKAGTYKWNVMCQPSRNIEDCVAESNLNCSDLSQVVSVEKN